MSRCDRLWPAHYEIFRTNPLSAGYGACGVAIFLKNEIGYLPTQFADWIGAQPVTADAYPPGILVGSAGVAVSLLELGLDAKAHSAMDACYASPLLYADPSMFYGVAGWGLCSLTFYQRSGRQHFLDMAVKAAESLLRTSVAEQGRRHWRGFDDGRIQYGYGFGAAGIGLFLLSIGQLLSSHRYLTAAAEALMFDWDNRVEGWFGLGWSDFEGSSRVLPYWAHGAAGVGMASIRFFAATNDPRYLQMAEAVAGTLMTSWSALPCQLNGMSGLGDFFVDMFRVTRRPAYLAAAFRLTRAIRMFALRTPDGIAFPGRWLSRISLDFATGSAGIGMFLQRVSSCGPKYLVDDPLLGSQVGQISANEAIPLPSGCAELQHHLTV